MKTSIKFLFVFAVLALAAGFFVAGDVSAQGTFSCRWFDGRCLTGIDGSNCQTGYVGNCSQFKTSTECGFEKTHTCQLDSNKFRCSLVQGFGECIVAEETCTTNYTANCSQFGGTGCPSSTEVQDCEPSPGGSGECNAGPGETCNQFCYPNECVTGYKCVPYSDSQGVCQPEGGCTTDDQCPSDNDIEYVCETGECKPSTLVGNKKLGPNQTTCRWVEGFSTGCIAADTCRAGSVGLWDTKFCGDVQQCAGLSKAECEDVPITQCETVENWGTQTCFNDCASGDPNSNLCCNAKCGTSSRACNTRDDCLAGADGWECVDSVCKFTGKAGFDCRSGGLIPCGGLDCPCTFCHIFIIINRVVDLLLFTIAPILVSIMVIVGGFFVMTSRGAGQLRRGKEYIKWAVLGYLLMLIAWVLVNTILSVLDLAEWVGAGDWWDPTC